MTEKHIWENGETITADLLNGMSEYVDDEHAQVTAQLAQTLQVGRINKSDKHKIIANPTMVAKVNTDTVNLMGSQDVSSIWYSRDGLTLGESIEVDGVVLTKIKSKNFYNSLRSQPKDPGNTFPLVLDPTKKYLCSAYCLTYGSPRFFYHTYTATGVNESVYVDNQLRRFWFVANGTDDINWYVQGNSGYNVDGTGYENEIYLGGFQVEEITDYKNGIITIGDSTFDGASGNDNMGNTEIPKMFGSLLNASFFNRAVSGNTTQQMINRWSTDITPLAPKSKYVLIQGGINNLGKSGTTAESILADHRTMHSLALQDGLVPIHANITPCGRASLDEEIRVKANELLSTEYGDSLLDISKIVGDPYETNKIMQIDGWKGDDVHYGQLAKDAVSDYIASQNFWELAKPSQFKKQ